MNSADGIWMGYERKRGAIVELVRLLCTGDTGSFKLMMPELPDKIQYCLTLDADTSLPMETLKELIGAAAHPLNAPVISEDMVVVDGYGVMAPRMETTAKARLKRHFHRYGQPIAAYPLIRPVYPTFHRIYSEPVYSVERAYLISPYLKIPLTI